MTNLERARQALYDIGIFSDEKVKVVEVALDAATKDARLEHFKQYKKALEIHIKEYPHLGDCDWNCTTVGPLHELIRKVRLEEANRFRLNIGMILRGNHAQGKCLEGIDSRIAELEAKP